jgi:4,5-dihydroxyphthalate decarboxylase
MAELPLLMACEAPTFQALYDGTVGFEGIDLSIVQVAPAERHRRMLQKLEFDICEYSSGNYLNGLPLGQPFTALPIFPLRQFRHRDIWIWQGAGIATPADLNGKRVGIGNWANSAALWERGLLVQDHGLDVASVDWVAGAPEDPRFTPPPWLRLRVKPTDLTLEQMLAAGELDAILLAHDAEFPPEAPVARLFPDYVTAEQEYFRRTHTLPTMHTVVIKNRLLAEQPWVAASVFAGLRRALDTYVERERSANAPSPLWPGLTWAEQEAWLGPQPWPCGLEANRGPVETAVRYAVQLGIVKRAIGAEEWFQYEGRPIVKAD